MLGILMLEKKIGMWVATAVGLGAIIGSGIFVLSGSAISLAGSNALIAFVMVGIVALIIAMEMGELVSIMPYAKGGVYSYVREAFGSELGFITGIIQYFSYSTSISAIAIGFGAYAASILGINYAFGPIALGISIIIVLTLVNLLGTKTAAKADAYVVVVKIAALIIFSAFALVLAFFLGHFSPSNFSVSQSQAGIGSIFEASIAIMFAYSGFQTIATISSRVKGGKLAAGKAIVLSVLISIVIYVLVVGSMMLLAPASGYKINADPLAYALQASSAPAYITDIVDIGAILATISATLAMIMASSRMVYQMSEDKLLPKLLRKYNKDRDVAVNGVILSAFLGIITMFAGNVFVIAAISTFGILFYYIMAGLALMHFRRKNPEPGFKVPLYPYLTIIATAFLILLMYGMPSTALEIGVTMIIGLLVLYYILREADDKKVVKIKLFS